MKKTSYKLKGMDCAACASLIEMDLEDVGVKANCSYPKETLVVKYDEAKIDEETIKNVVKSGGYELAAYEN